MNATALPKIGIGPLGSCGPRWPKGQEAYFFQLLVVIMLLFCFKSAWAIDLPGEDMSQNFETASSLVKTADTIFFGWGSPFVAAFFLAWAGFALVQHKIVMFLITVAAAIFILIIPKFVKDVKSLGGGTIFSGSIIVMEKPAYA